MEVGAEEWVVKTLRFGSIKFVSYAEWCDHHVTLDLVAQEMLAKGVIELVVGLVPKVPSGLFCGCVFTWVFRSICPNHTQGKEAVPGYGAGLSEGSGFSVVRNGQLVSMDSAEFFRRQTPYGGSRMVTPGSSGFPGEARPRRPGMLSVPPVVPEESLEGSIGPTLVAGYSFPAVSSGPLLVDGSGSSAQGSSLCDGSSGSLCFPIGQALSIATMGLSALPASLPPFSQVSRGTSPSRPRRITQADRLLNTPGATNIKACLKRNPGTPVESRSRSRSSLSCTTRAPLTPQFKTLTASRLPSLNLPPKCPVMWPSVPKTTRKSLTLKMKLDIIHRHKRGKKTIAMLATILPPFTVSTIFKSADSIKKADETVSSLQAKRIT
ncbi:hypothetical protein E2C01_053123 [Portunus trituberculatus]|uniref:Uncharacterized protein n=1 Tax=Portunus trituberculatus TaxID=210409 RepID=A0A5B7GNK7_PORTR|nr:hypothetical protein [Portunus trituberculatus]